MTNPQSALYVTSWAIAGVTVVAVLGGRGWWWIIWAMSWVLAWLAITLERSPDRVIGENYLCRWYVIPRNRFCNVYLHRFQGSDDDRALHDHPWASVSILFGGELWEVTSHRHPTGFYLARRIPRFLPQLRGATYAHRLELRGDQPAWTLFITGPYLRSWGFLCDRGWVHWRKFTDETGNRIGAGCD